MSSTAERGRQGDSAVQLTDAIRAGLACPETYPDRPASVELRETHISWVFLAGELAYKLKKPLVLDFLDYGTPARRREICCEEVRLNRQLAPDIYLGVRGVAVTGDGVELIDEDDPRAVDFVVEMRRYDERMSLEARLARGELDRHQMISVAGVLARFHAAAPRVRRAGSAVLGVEREFDRNLRELLACAQQEGEIARVQALEQFAHAFIATHARTFQTRANRGLVREGHGDLRAAHVLVDDDVRIVDCVEFDRDLRELDVADDLGFLVFDLALLGGERYGQLLIDAYRDAGGDPGDDSLVAFFAAYRALVRAKVALVRADQLPARAAMHGRESANARDLIVLAERFAWRARRPLTIVVCGVPASGKTHLARALAELSGLPHLSSDATRKRLSTIETTQSVPAPPDLYGSEWNARTYEELGKRAAHDVATNGGAIVDATFRHLADRRWFSAAFGSAPPPFFIECHAPRSVLVERAAAREHELERLSDADVEVVLRESHTWDPLDEVPASRHVTVRTDRRLEEVMAEVQALLDRRVLELALALGQPALPRRADR